MRAAAGLVEGGLPEAAEAVGAEVLDEDLEAGLRRLLEAAVGHEHVDERLDRWEGVDAGDEGVEEHGEGGRLAEAASDPQLIAGHAVDDLRHESEVVDQGVLSAAGRAAEGDVEPARELAVQLGRASHDGVGDQPGVGQAVEGLVEADAGVLGAHDVAERVPARRPGRQADAGEVGQQERDVSGLDPVELHVLAGGEVQPVGGVAGGEAAEAPELLGGGDAAGDAHPGHEHAVLELRADAVGLERVAVLGGEPPVALGGEALEVDAQAGALGGGDVGEGHARTVRTAWIGRVAPAFRSDQRPRTRPRPRL